MKQSKAIEKKLPIQCRACWNKKIIEKHLQIITKATKEKIKNKYKSMYKQIKELRKENEQLKNYIKIEDKQRQKDSIKLLQLQRDLEFQKNGNILLKRENKQFKASVDYKSFLQLQFRNQKDKKIFETTIQLLNGERDKLQKDNENMKKLLKLKDNQSIMSIKKLKNKG